jgi:tetratricopeptide (TPR) repeat protein
LSSIGVQRIIAAAEWAGLEKTAKYYGRLAHVLEEGGYQEEAIEAYNNALALDENSDIALTGLALLSFGRLEYQKAMDYLLKVLAVYEDLSKTKQTDDAPYNKEKMESFHRQSFIRISLLQDIMGNPDGSLETLERALQRFPGDIDITTRLILQSSTAEKNLPKAIEVFESLDQQSKLADYISQCVTNESFHGDLHEALVRVARSVNRLERLERAYLVAIQAAKKQKKTTAIATLQYHLSELYDCHLEQPSKAIEYWEKLRTRSYSKYGELAIVRLCEVQLLRALAVDPHSSDYETAFAELRKLAGTRNTASQSFRTRDGALMVGLLYRLRGQMDEARTYFKMNVKMAMDLISETDELNSSRGWEVLWLTMLKVGDVLNGNAALGVCLLKRPRVAAADDDDKAYSSLEMGEEASSTHTATSSKDANMESSEKEKPADGLDMSVWNGYLCDGHCSRPANNWSGGIYICTYCRDVQFCSDCISILRSGKLMVPVCGTNHEFVYNNGAPRNLPPGKILVGESLKDIGEWLNDIRVQYGIPIAIRKD